MYEGDEFTINVRDADLFGTHKTIGDAKVKVATFTNEKGFNDWIRVQKKGVETGKIHI